MLFTQVTWCLLALLGHLALWVGMFNRLHATDWPRWVIDALEKPVLLSLLGILGAVLYALTISPEFAASPLAVITGVVWSRIYFWLCCGIGAVVCGGWVHRVCLRRVPQWLSYSFRLVDVERQLGHLPCGNVASRWLSHLPGNQILELEVNTKHLALAQLPPALEGLSIAHISDLHFTGHLTQDFFACAVEQVNALDVDLVAITGDLLDDADLLTWIPSTLGQLRSRAGTYCIFGNHDRWLGVAPQLREALEAAGLVYLGGRWTEVRVRGQTLQLGGDERPWFPPLAEPPPCPGLGPQGRAPRILLSHSPDTIEWASEHDIDLLLAGHVHGGQIRFPVIGAVVCPSHFGVRYASGVHYVSPTVLHVSRGLSGKQTLRINCRPEITKLVLHASGPITIPLPEPKGKAARLAWRCHGLWRLGLGRSVPRG